nr:uncharacterized protein LOC121117273 [Lepeophtheirus salmonis]
MEKVNTLSSIKRKNPTTVPEEDDDPLLCCAPQDDVGEHQVDLCPRSWWCCCCEGENRSFGSILWRIIFIFCWVPLCYPCYLSRTLRRRSHKRDIPHPKLNLPPTPTISSPPHPSLMNDLPLEKPSIDPTHLP